MEQLVSKNDTRYLIAGLLLCVCVLVLIACKKTESTPQPSLTFTMDSLTCEKNGTGCINAAKSTIPLGGAISYSIDKLSIAKVDAATGTIIPVAEGAAMVTAIQAATTGVNQQATASYVLTITSPHAQLTFATAGNLICYVGSSTCANPASSNIPDGGVITYSVDNTNVAMVNATTGKITPVAAGKTIITARQDSKPNTNQASTATYNLTVEDPIPVLKFATPGNFKCETGSSTSINAVTSTIPSGGAITYSIDKTNIAQVNTTTGKITPLVTGTAVVTATQQAKAGVNQQATATYNLTVSTPTITLSPGTTQALYYPAKSYVITVTTSVAWTAISNNASWCSVLNNTSTGNGSFVVACSAYNISGNSRTATVIVSGPGGTPKASLDFAQFGYPPNPSLTLNDGVHTGTNLSIGVSTGGSNYTISVASNLEWIASSGNSAWCGANASGFGNGSFLLSCGKNSSGGARAATVTVKSTDGKYTAVINVTQY